MKIKENYMLRKVADTYVVVPIGKEVSNFNGMINLNSAGAFLWQQMETDISFDNLLELFMSEYEVDSDTATKDLRKFISNLEESNLLE